MRSGALFSAVGLLAVVPFGDATAQDADPTDGGVLFEMTASQSIFASDNYDLVDPAVGEVRSITSLVGGLSSITRSNSFILGFQAGVEVGDDGFELGDTGVDLSYTMMGANSEIELFADYLTRLVTSEFVEDVGGVGTGEVFVADGTRVSFGYGARVLYGADGPVTFALRGARREIQFDSTDPDATDSRRFTLNGSLSAAVDPATRVRVTASYGETDEDDAEETFEENTRVGLGITRDLGNATTVSADVNWQEVRQTSTLGTDVTNGIGGRLAFARDLPNGSFGGSAEREITVDGTIDEIRVNRQIEFPASALGLEAGIAVTGGDTVSPLLGITYRRLAPDGALTLSVTQGARLDGDSETVLNTVGTAAYTQDINALSSYRAAVSVTNQSAIEGDDTTRRIEGSLVYNRDLTDRVSLSTGYEHARIFETGDDERVSNTVFVTISRVFSARP